MMVRTECPGTRHRGSWVRGRRRVWLSVSMSPDLRAEIEEASTRAGMAAGAWIREVLADTLNLESEDA